MGSAVDNDGQERGGGGVIEITHICSLMESPTQPTPNTGSGQRDVKFISIFVYQVWLPIAMVTSTDEAGNTPFLRKPSGGARRALSYWLCHFHLYDWHK